ncbi:hypothetical protein [Mariprofundus ferrooxydans]|uniref:Uncharacterized protein n=1 Tax=Mariprofundus ferrooxydans PV-1 TaxID=314345 RepID=Q0F121_9PROT|nr:hypothetical protein [Mariprofundus ferrooxydans]EAU55370.1 hypothetical protein SPV1_11576 [Mariprofundus ferrooxydans PV-1]KON47711.1 hypothetical protein AL013_06990 [Mariprofundus ferrooxydans]
MRWLVVYRRVDERGGPVGIREDNCSVTWPHTLASGALMLPGNKTATCTREEKDPFDISSG